MTRNIRSQWYSAVVIPSGPWDLPAAEYYWVQDNRIGYTIDRSLGCRRFVHGLMSVFFITFKTKRVSNRQLALTMTFRMMLITPRLCFQNVIRCIEAAAVIGNPDFACIYSRSCCSLICYMGIIVSPFTCNTGFVRTKFITRYLLLSWFIWPQWINSAGSLFCYSFICIQLDRDIINTPESMYIRSIKIDWSHFPKFGASIGCRTVLVDRMTSKHSVLVTWKWMVKWLCIRNNGAENFFP